MFQGHLLCIQLQLLPAPLAESFDQIRTHSPLTLTFQVDQGQLSQLLLRRHPRLELFQSGSLCFRVGQQNEDLAASRSIALDDGRTRWLQPRLPGFLQAIFL